MADNKEIIKLAVDSYRGNVEKYSTNQAQDVLRQALIEANNGKDHFDYRDVRDGKCHGIFSLIEEVLDITVVEGLQSNDYFNTLVDFRNVALGDTPVFEVEDQDMFVVADVAEGTQGIRRQRLGGVSLATIKTSPKAIRIYEEMNRVLAGRVDLNKMINMVSESYEQELLNEIYSLWISATADELGGAVYFPAAGSYDEDTLLDIIAHVEAAAGGKTATIIGTRKAVRNLKESVDSDAAKDEMHNYGYYGRFYGTPIVVTPQRHKIGSTDFVLDDNMLTIIAGDQKPIKCVYEGQPLVIVHDPMYAADFTQEYFYESRWGMGIVLSTNTGIGRYEIA